MDIPTIGLIGSVLIMLIGASVAVPVLRRYKDYGVDPAVLDTLAGRIRFWWLLFGSLTCAFLFGHIVTVLLFLFISFWALREYITLTKTRPADHHTLFWIFFLATPLQFILVSLSNDFFMEIFGCTTYQVYSILIPAFAFLMIPAAIACSNDYTSFLERVAKIEVGLLICVYSLSFAPALLTIDLSAANNVKQQEPVVSLTMGGELDEIISSTINSETAIVNRPNRLLLFFFVLIVQISDVFQYLWSHIRFRHVIAPLINQTKTWEGVFGGAATTALVGTALWIFTPFPNWWQPGAIAFAVSMMGFAGAMTMSAIKRDRGVPDYGTLIEGHSGVLDRIDSLCFSAPIFFHLAYIFIIP